MRPILCLVLMCNLLCGCKSWGPLKPTPSGPLPATFPEQLHSFSGPEVAFAPDGKAWDSAGIGGPSNVLYLNGTYWVCTSGYGAEGNVTQAIGCWFGKDFHSLKPYPKNPILVNSKPKWSASCIEGPTFNSDGKNVYLSYVGFSSNCDDEEHGVIGISSTPVERFPEGYSVAAEPQIRKPKELKWMFRSSILEIDGKCYDYTNAGVLRHRRFHRGSYPAPVVASFKTDGPCATTEMRTDSWKFNRLEINASQPWEGNIEVEEPQVFRTADGEYIMLYGGAWTFKAGYAFNRDPTHDPWIKSDSNPIRQDGVLWLPRIAQDASGQYWMFGNFNNTRQMNLWKGLGPVVPPTVERP